MAIMAMAAGNLRLALGAQPQAETMQRLADLLNAFIAQAGFADGCFAG